MAQEIERKFLVSGDFSPFVTRRERIVQGYLCADAERTVRVRICGDKAFLTVKSATVAGSWSRYEFETPIPTADAEEMLKLCLPGVIDKHRHWIEAGKHTWEVDVFHGDNEGLVVAEIELESEDEAFAKPDWVGDEVTHDPRYYNSALAQLPFTKFSSPNRTS
ncbi:MAG: CYTH domain-containing protein [Tannerella sp.]|jgi:CYTH domain-containing protein|nr:CYTH domain-containing protein [Tannerella sp.]